MLHSGKHYNRCWNVDEIINDALERHFIRQYLQEYKQLINNLQCLKGIDGTKENILNNDAITPNRKRKAKENSAVLVNLYGNAVQTSSVSICNKQQQFANADYCVRSFSPVMFCNQQSTLCSVRNLLHSTVEEFGFNVSRSI